MNIRFLLSFFVLAFFSSKSFAFTELSFDFGYDKQVYGSLKQNKQTSRSYQASVAFYLFKYTAIEFNASHSEEETLENNVIPVSGTNVSVVSLSTNVTSDTLGLGLRQAFAARGAFVRPFLSIGYANQVIRDRTTFTFRDNTSGVTDRFSDPINKARLDSIFMSFAMQFQLTELFSIKGSVQSVFPAFEFDRLTDDLKYTAGFSWIF
ncbi:MAG: hypothetical protein COW01_14995 [Bdellovibrionales bacterium CG12_big_fil_rev_8_21_14_0_65_38_15]|nr:MAG: hypothetical protein COW79_09745 [Bdellovibrionales bacterium CG22_combo_CG10-13_8_21_14_all_38_13]PIQ52743.1 MAG: hypothetical protein COW01_14995 [Bdellovibrionales bacterium CG12_big_fil_rev_8_21_14_0_65_38_15]PIR31432.1 MAG: hypothetical protein COV38_00505 [Bdellovibrionales bacterium CG11_big_fil_rev_8_21_14_0_20_38_13]